MMLNDKIGFAKVDEVMAQLLDLDRITVADQRRLQGIQSRLRTNQSQITFGDIELVKMLAQEHLMPRIRGGEVLDVKRNVDDANVRDQREGSVKRGGENPKPVGQRPSPPPAPPAPRS